MLLSQGDDGIVNDFVGDVVADLVDVGARPANRFAGKGNMHDSEFAVGYFVQGYTRKAVHALRKSYSDNELAELVDHIKQDIIFGRLRPGERLIEDD